MAGRGKTATIQKAAKTALSAPERMRRVLVPVAFWSGWLGVGGLLGCGVLALVPEESWPAGLDPDRLPFYAVVSLCVASLIGWGCVQDGESRVKRTTGRPVALVLFLVLPIAAGVLSYLDAHVLETPLAEWPGGTWIALFARWYTPLLVALSLIVFLSWRTRPRTRVYLGRGAWFAVLVAPYVLLLALILFDLPAPWVEEPVEDALGTVGESSIVLQLIVGYFLGDGAGD
jgi:hypothetical protein